MKQSWTKGVDRELAVDIKQNFKESLVMRRRLLELLSEKVSTSQKTAKSKALYDNPNWAFLQADSRGYERAMHEIADLLLDASVEN